MTYKTNSFIVFLLLFSTSGMLTFAGPLDQHLAPKSDYKSEYDRISNMSPLHFHKHNAINLLNGISDQFLFFLSNQNLSPENSYKRLSKIQTQLIEFYENLNGKATFSPNLESNNEIDVIENLKISILLASNAELIGQYIKMTLNEIYETNYEEAFPGLGLHSLEKYLNSLKLLLSSYDYTESTKKINEIIAESISIIDNSLNRKNLNSDEMHNLYTAVLKCIGLIKNIHENENFIKKLNLKEASFKKEYWSISRSDGINAFIKCLFFRVQIMKVQADNGFFYKNDFRDFFSEVVNNINKIARQNSPKDINNLRSNENIDSSA